MSIVLDASAIIAMLKEESGAAKVASATAGARVSSVNYAKVVNHFRHAGTLEQQVNAMLDPLPLTVVPTDKTLARFAARFRASTATGGLSTDHYFCLALAPRDRLPAWISEQNRKKVADAVDVEVVAIR